ncbi:MAG: hypothetical protein ACRD2P_04665 [Terriglobia bacterium]
METSGPLTQEELKTLDANFERASNVLKLLIKRGEAWIRDPEQSERTYRAGEAAMRDIYDAAARGDRIAFERMRFVAESAEQTAFRVGALAGCQPSKVN